MPLEILREYIESNYRITEYTNGFVVKSLIQDYIPPTLDDIKTNKLNTLYDSYQQEKNSAVTSSLIGSDGKNIVFEYGADNQIDYTKIATKLALNTSLTQSIIGSKSHGKFYINREDFGKLVNDFDNHEVNLYLKFSDKKALVESATTNADVDAVVW
jgi:hypothetical protein